MTETENKNVSAKVILNEHDIDTINELKNLFASNNITALKAQGSNLLKVLESNIDLGAIFVSDSNNQYDFTGIELAKKVHYLRKELPIFYRTNQYKSLDELDSNARKYITGIYSLEDTSHLQNLIDQYIFPITYPNSLIRGIQDLSIQALKSQFKVELVTSETPYVVRDQLLHGDVMSLIPTETSWCRGYMMLQANKLDAETLVEHYSHGNKTDNPSDFRHINDIMNDVTNLVWGNFRSKFHSFDDYSTESTALRSEVPIIINQLHNYISFGSSDPILTFRYFINDDKNIHPPILIVQQIIFHLGWCPELFEQHQQTHVDNLVNSGVIDFF